MDRTEAPAFSRKLPANGHPPIPPPPCHVSTLPDFGAVTLILYFKADPMFPTCSPTNTHAATLILYFKG